MSAGRNKKSQTRDTESEILIISFRFAKLATQRANTFGLKCSRRFY